MEPWITTLITVVCSIIASSGFWAFMLGRANKKDAKSKMLLGLGHDRLLYLCMNYIDRGVITNEELENIHEYLYTPYLDLGGNGTVSRLMKRVDGLPVTRAISKNKKEEDL